MKHAAVFVLLFSLGALAAEVWGNDWLGVYRYLSAPIENLFAAFNDQADASGVSIATLLVPFFLCGIGGGYLFGSSKSVYRVVYFPIGFGIWMWGSFAWADYQWGVGTWEARVLEALWLSTLTGAACLGLAFGRLLSFKRRPTWSLMHLILVTVYASVLCLSFFAGSPSVVPITILAGLLGTAAMIEFRGEWRRRE